MTNFPKWDNKVNCIHCMYVFVSVKRSIILYFHIIPKEHFALRLSPLSALLNFHVSVCYNCHRLCIFFSFFISGLPRQGFLCIRPVLSPLNRSRQMAALPVSGFDGGRFLRKGRFPLQGLTLRKSKDSISCVGYLAKTRFYKLALYKLCYNEEYCIEWELFGINMIKLDYM